MAAEMNSKISMDVNKDERLYSFCMPQGSPVGEAYDACFEVLQLLLSEAARLSKNAEKKQKEEESAQEEPKPEGSDCKPCQPKKS